MEYPIPGNGYTIREYLGGGNWKDAFRASTPVSLSDVALLYFRQESTNEILQKDVVNLLRAVSQHKYAGYLAEFKGVQKGEDGRFFIIEELLLRPLNKIAPVNDLTMFVRIARDLCRGLTCLHASRLIHRDLKLDNCGLDHQQRAKIFDYGTITSDPGEIRGSVFTRAPELFVSRLDVEQRVCDAASDVWALGATLFALRANCYPFVHQNEVQGRQLINDRVRRGELTQARADLKKRDLDAAVTERILRPMAQEDLKSRVHEILHGRSEETLLSMLEFDPNRRNQIENYAEAWNEISIELGASVSGYKQLTEWEATTIHLRAAERKELVLSRKQLERLIADFTAAKTAGSLTETESQKIEASLRKVRGQ